MNTIKRIIEIGNPIYIIRHLWKHRYLIGQMTWREFGLRYRGSYLGMLWSILYPLFTLLIYTFVFSVVFKARWQSAIENQTSTGEFAIVLFAGLIPFYFFSEVINKAPGLILNYPNYVKKVVFPLEILVVVICGSALFSSFFNIGIILIATMIVLHTFQPTIILLPLIYLPLVLLTSGFAWFLASLGVYIRDIGQFISLVTQIFLFISPIFYPISSVPEKFQNILRLNPLTMIVTNCRNLLLWGELFSIREWAIWTLISIVIAIIGYIWFIWTKRGFADVL